MGITTELIDYILSCRFENIPSSVIDAGKDLLLDSLGCALAGYSVESNKIFIDVIKGLGGVPEATIIGDGGKTSCFNAAYVNTKLANLLDMDDVLWNVAHHGTGVIHSALTIAERERSSGKDFLNAICLGYEVGARTSLAVGTIFDFDGKKLVYGTRNAYGFGAGIFGATAAAGLLLRLTAEQFENALGITAAYAPVPLTQKLNQDYSMCKYQLEWTASGAVMASLLARNGFTGPAGIFDDDLFALAMGRRYYHPEFLTQDLGKKWFLTETSLKPYPSCRHTHYALDLFQDILEKNNLKADEIEEVKIKGLNRLTRWPWVNPVPKDIFWGEFSVPYNIAVMAYKVRPGPEWYHVETMKDPRILDFCKKVKIEANPEAVELEGIPDAFIRRPTVIEVKGRGGQFFTARKESARGDGFSQSDRMTREEVREKFLSNSGNVIGTRNAETLWEMIHQLEQVKHVGKFIPFLRKPA
jgi:2-methylcitrate dehydratase PrpD